MPSSRCIEESVDLRQEIINLRQESTCGVDLRRSRQLTSSPDYLEESFVCCKKENVAPVKEDCSNDPGSVYASIKDFLEWNNVVLTNI